MATKEYHKVSLYRETATLTDESITPGAPSGTLKLGASGNFGVHTLQVELGEGWQGLTVHAIFWLNGAGVLGNSLLSNGEISIPAAVTASPTNVGFVTFSGTSSGVNRLTATLPFIVTDGPPSEGEPSPDPDPSLWQQLFDKMEEVVSTYILPIMSEETLGGGRAIKKTTETVPVAVDPLDGRLYVPEQSGGGSDYKLPQATETTLGGVKAKQRTSETLEVAIDKATGKLYVPQQGGGGSYVLPVATEGVLGGIKAPAKTSETVKVVVDADGFLYIKDYAEKSAIPTKVSQLQNDSNFLTKESDPTVPEWAKQPQKPTYTADEVGAQAKGDYALKNEIPTKLPNPQRLTFTGAVNKTYDGSSAVTVNIPTGGGGGEPGAAAGFGTPTATASALEPGAQPTVEIQASGPDTAKIFAFTFGIPKGQDGAPGEPGKTPQKGTDYWTTEEQQQIVDEAATAAAGKVPTATAEQTGTIKAEPVESTEGLEPIKIGPDGKGYVSKSGETPPTPEYKSLVNASEYTNSGYAGENFDQFGANINIFSGEVDTSEKKQIYYRLCRNNKMYGPNVGLIVACYDQDGRYLYKMEDNKGDYTSNFVSVSTLNGTNDEPLEILETGSKIVVKCIALLNIPEEVKKIKFGVNATVSFSKDFYPLFFVSYNPITNYGSITDGDFSPVEGGGSSDLARPLTNKTVLFIGDSLTDWGGGGDIENGFLKILHDRTGVLTVNKGLAGATWEQAKGQTKPGVVRVDEYVASKVKYDCVAFLLGTNVSDEGTVEDTAETKTTMCGAIKYCIETLIKYSPTTPIVVFLPPQRVEGNDKQKQRNDNIKSICEKYSIDTFDLYSKSQIVSETLVPGSGNLSDGLHLGENGKTNMGRAVCRGILQVMGY